jgi:hypothetical protein
MERIVMQSIRTLLATTFAAAVLASGAAVSAHAQQKGAKPQRPQVIIIDRSLGRPPPPPHERNYVGPAPSTAPPMQRIPQVAPLAQPPIPR